MRRFEVQIDDLEFEAFEKLRKQLGLKTWKETWRWMLETGIYHVQHVISEHNKVEAAFDAGMNDYTPL